MTKSMKKYVEKTTSKVYNNTAFVLFKSLKLENKI